VLAEAREVFAGLAARPLVAEAGDWLRQALARTS
jgi:hypothetical protein